MTLRLLPVLVFFACGADSVSTTPPATPPPVTPKPTVAPSAAPVLTVAPRAAPAPLSTVAPIDECRRACDYQASCLPASYRDHDPNACLTDCRANLESRDPKNPSARPKVWADCLTALPCHEIERSMAMNMGPAGYCYEKAIH